jgi:hypothetical protein
MPDKPQQIHRTNRVFKSLQKLLSFVRIDSRQRTVQPVSWQGDFDRPIFFFELRDRYVCSWCELHNGQLILVPTAQSRGRARHVRYPADATILGRVTAVTMRIADLGQKVPKGPPPPA